MERVSAHLTLVTAAVVLFASACHGGAMDADPGDTPYTPYDPPAADTGTTPGPDGVDEDAGVVTYDDAGVPVDPDVDLPLPAELLTHWQVNIEWTREDMGEQTFHRRILEKNNLPDIISAQELWPVPLCGDNRHRGQDARSERQACTGDNYGGRSFMGLLEARTERQYDVRYIADHANAVIWDEERLSHVASTQWRFGQTRALRNACCPGSSESGCASRDSIGIAVLLRDNRLTEDPADDTLVSVASVHTGGFGGRCIAAHLRQADDVFDQWEGRHTELPLMRRFISGDLNTRADSSSSNMAARRREANPECWWRGFTRNHSCGSRNGSYLDTVWAKHFDGASGNRAPICSMWTFPMNTGGADRCDHTRDSAGQVYQRIDYTFLDGPMLNRSMVRSHVDKGFFDKDGDGRFDFGEAYSDSHRGIYTEVDYTDTP